MQIFLGIWHCLMFREEFMRTFMHQRRLRATIYRLIVPMFNRVSQIRARVAKMMRSNRNALVDRL